MGRAACGLNLTDRNFAALPSHFASDNELLNESKFANSLPGFDEFPSCFKAVVLYLLASIPHHKQFLVSTLALTHPLFLSRIWTSGFMEILTGTVQAGCGLNRKTEMTATGVPPTFVIASELDALSARVEILQRSVLEEQQTLLTTVVEKMDALPSSIGDHKRHNMEINGVVHVTVSDVT